MKQSSSLLVLRPAPSSASVRAYAYKTRLVFALIAAALLVSLASCRAGGLDPFYGAKMKRFAKTSAEQQERAAGEAQSNDSQSADGVQVVFQIGHSAEIQHVAMSPNGRFILSSDTRVVKLWDVASGKELRTFASQYTPASIGFSPDSAHVFISGMRPTLDRRSEQGAVVFDASSGRQIADLPVLSADARFGALHVGSYMTVTDLTNGRQSSLSSNAEINTPIAFSDNGTRLLMHAFGTERVLVVGFKQVDAYAVWDVEARRKLLSVPRQDVSDPPIFSPDGRYLVIQNRDGSIVAHELQTNEQRRMAVPHSVVASLLITPDSRRLLIENSDRSVDAYELSSAEKRPIAAADSSGKGGFVVSPDGQILARAHDGSTDIYDLSSGRRLVSLEQPTGAWDSAVFSADHRFLAAHTSAGIRLWEIPSGRVVSDLKSSTIAFSADNRTAILGSSGSGVPVLDELATGRQKGLTGVTEPVTDIVVAANGRFAVTTSDRSHATLWDLGAGRLERSIACPGGSSLTSLSASPHEALLAGGCMNGGAWLWDLTSAQAPLELTPSLPDAAESPTVVRFSADGRLLAIGVKEHVAIWEFPARQKIRELQLPRDSVGDSYGPAIDAGDLKNLPKEYREEIERAEQTRAAMAARYADIPGPQTDIVMLAVDPNSQSLAIIRMQKTVTHLGPNALTGIANLSLYNLQDGKLVHALAPHSVISLGSAGNDCWDRTGSAWDAKSLGLGLAFVADGRALYTAQQSWDVATGRKIPGVCKAPHSNEEIAAEASRGAAISVAMSSDGRTEARAIGRVVRLWDAKTGQVVRDLTGHVGQVQSIAFAGDGKTLLSGAADGSLRIWKLAEGREVAALYSLDTADFVAVTPDQYYRASKSRLSDVSFRAGNQVYPFEQFDLRFNRPDIILERLGYASPQELQNYRTAHERRLKKIGFTDKMLKGDFHLPELSIISENPPVSTQETSIQLRVRSSDDKDPLDRINVMVNEVPVFGTAGIGIGDVQTHRDERTINVPLIAGLNKIQVSVLNRQGTESRRETVYITSTASFGPGDTYIVAIGVSQYRNSKYDLRFAAKDAADLVNAYRNLANRAGSPERVHILEITNDKATRTGILAARDWLKQAHPNDLAIVFAAGHGMIDARQDYYFGTYDIDPEQPQVSGLPYPDFEALFDGIPALKRMLLLDTCFSGEIDQEEPAVVTQVQKNGEGSVKMRAFKAIRGVAVVADPSNSTGGTQGNTNHTLAADVQNFQDMFADLRRGTGAVVISSASGNEYALEGEKWNNGVFTYALLSGLNNQAADLNHDGIITVGELQAYVIDQVRKLTDGGQNPTVRRENLDFDFSVYQTGAIN